MNPDLEHEHSPEAIRARLAEGPSPSYLRDWVYGGIDGAVTTFAIVAGVVGAGEQDADDRAALALGFLDLGAVLLGAGDEGPQIALRSVELFLQATLLGEEQGGEDAADEKACPEKGQSPRG